MPTTVNVVISMNRKKFRTFTHIREEAPLEARNLKGTSQLPSRAISRGASPPSFSHDTKSDDMSNGIYRAFDLYHRLHVKSSVETSEKNWYEQERLRKWRSEQAISSLGMKQKTRDKHVIEAIIADRNRKIQNNNEDDYCVNQPSSKGKPIELVRNIRKPQESSELLKIAHQNAKNVIRTRTYSINPLPREDMAYGFSKNNCFYWG